jgi:hypothetical protein
MDEVSFLDSLMPTADDVDVCQVVPVCAPWSIIRNYSYRVKLVPGGQKKGKLSKSVVSIISQSASQPVRNAIKGILDTDLVQCLFVKSASLSLTTSESSTLRKIKNKTK